MAHDGSLLSAQHSVPSPDGASIATIQHSRLIIRSATTKHIIGSFSLSQEFATRCNVIRWSSAGHCAPATEGEIEDNGLPQTTQHILLADEDTIRTYSIFETSYYATITSGGSNLSKLFKVAFGNSQHEILVFSDFGFKATIWSLITSRGVEIRDPKYSVSCYDFRPRTGHLAILTRTVAQDILMLLEPECHELLKSVELPTVDAQEVRWSLDGCWFAIRDTASIGPKVLVYTAEGHLFKTYGGQQAGGNEIELGIKSLEWAESGILILGCQDDVVTILSRNTFTPIAHLNHPPTIHLPQASIWQEQINATKERSYIIAAQPTSPPTSTSLAKSTSPKNGISTISFNFKGSLMATKSDAAPTTVWIWSLQTGSAVAVLIHHSPVKLIAWHPIVADLLLIHCAIPEPAVHLWRLEWPSPLIVDVPLHRANGRLEAYWLQSASDDTPNLMLSSAHQYSTVQISSEGEVIPPRPQAEEQMRTVDAGAADLFDEGNSLDLSPIKLSHDTVEISVGYSLGNEDSSSGFGDELADTFHYRRHIKAVG